MRCIMTVEGFLSYIEGYENDVLHMTINGEELLCYYVSAVEDMLKLRPVNSQRPRLIKASLIDEVAFEDEVSSITNNVLSTALPIKETVHQENHGNVVLMANEIIKKPEFVYKENRKQIILELKESDNKALICEWNSANSMFDNAKKNHCLADKSDRIIEKLDNIFSRYYHPAIKLQLGDVFYELGDYVQAINEYSEGGYYYNAAIASSALEDNKKCCEVLANEIILNDNRFSECLSAFFYYSASAKCGALCAFVVQSIVKNEDITDEVRKVIFYGLVYIIEKYGFIQNIFPLMYDVSDDNIHKLYVMLCNITSNESFDKIEKNTAHSSIYANNDTELKIDNMTGIITMFLPKENYGFIDKKFYFNSEQVEDDGLRRRLILGEAETIKFKVNFCLGQGRKGTAADHIVPAAEISGGREIISGIIWDYSSANDVGTIGVDKKTYKFRFESIIDPYLKKYFENEFKYSNIQVDFLAVKSGKDRFVTAMWLSDDSTGNQIIADYTNNVSNSEKSLFDNRISEIKGVQYVSIDVPAYRPLPPLVSKPEIAADTVDIYKDNEKVVYTDHIFQDNEYELDFENDDSLFAIKRPFDKGQKSLTVYKDLTSAERYFCAAVVQNDNTASAIGNLVSIYLRRDASDIDKGIHLIKKYSNILGDEKYINNYMQLLSKKKDYAAMCELLEESIRKTYKVNTKLHYINTLAQSYLKQKKYDNAAKWFKEWKRVKNASKVQLGSAAFNNQYSLIENSVDRELAIALYLLGNKDEAINISNSLLRKNSTDSIVLAISADRYVPEDSFVTDSILNNESNSSDEYYYDNMSDDAIPEYIKQRMNSIRLSSYMAKQKFIEHIHDDTYDGTLEEAKNDIKSFEGGVRGLPFEPQSDAWLAIAKIIYQKRRSSNDESLLKKNGLSAESMMYYMGRSMKLLGDAAISNNRSRDTARYFYSQTIEILSHTSLWYKQAFSMLIESYGLDDNGLRNMIVNFKKDSLVYLPHNWKESHIFNMTDFIIMTFTLDKKASNDDMRSLANKMYSDDDFRRLAVDAMRDLCHSSTIIDGEDSFFSLWKEAKLEYTDSINKLEEMLRSIPNKFEMMDALEKSVNDIMLMMSEKLLCETDLKYIDQLINIVKLYISIREKKSTSGLYDRIDAYETIVNKCKQIISLINDEPTDISFGYIRPLSEMIISKINEEREQCYSESVPDLCIYPEQKAYYDEAANVEVRFYIENKMNKLTADNIKVRIRGYENSVEYIKCIKDIESIKGGVKSEYTAKMKVSDNEISKNSFDVSFHLEYDYQESQDTNSRNVFEDRYQINLYGKDEFEKIEPNPYSNDIEGNGMNPDSNLFVGRDEEIRSIINTLGSGRFAAHRGIYIYGQKRSGKTSILQRLTAHIENAYPDQFIIVDFKSLGDINAGDKTFERNFMSSILRKIRDTLKGKHPNLFNRIEKEVNIVLESREIITSPDYAIRFGEAMSKICSLIDNRTILFLIDEYTYIYEWIIKGEISESFTHFWKGLLQNYNVCSILCAMESMQEFVNAYPNDFGSMTGIKVSYLKEEGARQLIVDPILNDGKSRFDEVAVKRLYNLTAGSAYLLMILCNDLVEYMNDTTTTHVSETTIERFISLWIYSNRDFMKIFDPQINDPRKILSKDKDSSKHDNIVLLTYIAKNCDETDHSIEMSRIRCENALSIKTNEHLKNTITTLIDRDVIEADGEKCRIKVDILRIYLKERG